MAVEIGDQFKDEFEGEAEFFLETGSQVFNRDVKEAAVFYKLLGESRFRMVRDASFELVFVHLTEDWMRQAKISLAGLNCAKGIAVKLIWDKNRDTLSVKAPDDAAYITAEAVQID